MKHTTLALPDDLTDWLSAGDRAAELHSDTVAVDPELSRQMALVRRLVELGRATRDR